MLPSSIVDRLSKLNVWKRSGERAPHKPLLILMALGAFQRGARTFRFVEYEQKLRELLREFGPSRRSYHAEYPFWRLQQDGLWCVTADAPMQSRQSNTDPTLRELRAKNAIGHFPAELTRQLTRRPTLIGELALRVLSDHFPTSIHQDILDAVGLSIEPPAPGIPPRDPEFRIRILRAYGYRCALCGLDLRINNLTIALDAAHIRWHQAGGPDVETNGIALCSLHHKLFDLGAFTIVEHGKVLVSEQVHGAAGFEEALLNYHCKRVAAPTHPEHAPSSEYLAWHRSQVFKERPRP